MKEELKYIVISTVQLLLKNQGIKVSNSLSDFLINTDNWCCITTKTQIINNATMWCYEFIPPKDSDVFFLQVEIQTEFKTVVAINVISDPNAKIIKYN